ncbi:hypothetical protein [Streptomyces sp. Isolate_45]|nr:hypothetical protein [Streptomyces sp. Isolate_45]MDA5279613.1 hypothetical protein [Streptomyces sp. Isolate_45]
MHVHRVVELVLRFQVAPTMVLIARPQVVPAYALGPGADGAGR